MKARLFWLTLGLALIVAGCGSKNGSSAGGNDVAAVVNDHSITVAEVQKIATNMKRQGAEPDSTAEGATLEEKLYRTALDRLIEQQLLLDAAAKKGITVSEDEVNDSITQLKAGAGSEENFQKLLADNDVTEEEVRRDMRTNLILKQYFDQIVDQNPEVTDQDIQTYYDENQDRFGPQPQVHARHILIRTDPQADDMKKAETRKKAADALARVQAGEDFAKVAKEISEDPGSASRGGDLDWFGHGQMVAPFDSAAFALKPGEISGLVKTRFGYHILKSEGNRMSPGQTLEQVSGPIRGYLRQKKIQDQFRAVLDSLKAGADIKINKIPEGTLSKIGS